MFKWKCAKHTRSGALLEVDMMKKWALRISKSKCEKHHMFVPLFGYWSIILYPVWTSSRRIHGVKPPEQWLDFVEFMSGRPPVRLDTSGFYCLSFWIVFDPPGLLEWNKFQRVSTKSGHPRIMTLACVFLQTCPPSDFIWFQSWMTVWLCPLVWLDPLNSIFFSALLIFFGTVCWQIRQSCQSCEMSVTCAAM